MNKEIQDKAFQYIDAVAEKLGVAVDKVYEVMYKQMIVEGVMHAVTAVTSVAIVTFGLKYFLKLLSYLEKKDDENWQEDRWGIFIIITWIVYIILVIVSIISLYLDIPMAIGKLVNPEYYMIEEIKDMLK
ncbi:hypothetical protein CON39_11825 [Bacillus thuringiensis]|uniref:hypothetical protein n=1 Tax=Bacillus thuringiensis TaxID=1428 RepID=UPI000BEDD480|nr:hypothetical protein [Bacillus thuringiensis]PEF30354.1 hypothetical protein CON39_11825 [Bacillus thuringiensis]